MQPESPGNLGDSLVLDFQDQLLLMDGWLGLVIVDAAEFNLTPWLKFMSLFLT